MTDAVFKQQINGKVFDKEFRGVLQRLLVERVQNGVSSAIRGSAGARHRAFAVVLHMPAERALVNFSFLGSAERHAVMFEFDHGGRCVLAHVFDGVLIAQPVGTLDRVVHVPAPLVRGHIRERRGDTALGGHRMAAGREDLGDASGLEALGSHSEGGAQSRAASADDNDVVLVLLNFIRFHFYRYPKAMRTTARTLASAPSTHKNSTASCNATSSQRVCT